jgi:hypothetical protein
MASKDEQDMLKRLRELEEENARLRSAAKPAKPTVTESEYKGHPTLTFEGAFRPFSMGLKKLLVIREVWPEVEAFLERHSEVPPKPTDNH